MKQRRFGQNTSFHLNENSTKLMSIKSSIAILILKINSIISLPNSIVSLEVGHLFQMSP